MEIILQKMRERDCKSNIKKMKEEIKERQIN